VFRYSDGARPEDVRTEAIAPAGAVSAPTANAEPRLVGLVRRAGALVAALAIDGEVVLAGPGETAGGITVLSVDEDGVLFRRADGSEGRLTAS
jgi:ethanolamine utilization protein EutA (predicted chaperonin)